jgi:type I restriction enzyme S subunit
MINTKAGYRNSAVGVVPEDWKIKKVQEIANVVRGASPRPAGDPIYFDGDFMPWLTVSDLTNISDAQLYVTQTGSYLTKEGSKHSRRLSPGTVIISNSGATLGVSKILNIECCANDGVAALSNLSDADASYISLFLNSKTKYFRDVLAPGNGQPNLNTDLIGNVNVPLPPLPEQRAIADLLSTWDTAIDKTERLIAAKEKHLRDFTDKVAFGRKRLNGVSKNTLADGPFYSYPTDWMYCRIGDVASEVSLRGLDKSTKIPVLTCSKYAGFVNSLDYFGKKVFSEDTSNYKVIQKGQFGFPSNHVEEGSIGLLEHCEEGIVSPIYVIFKVNNEKVFAPFLYTLFKTSVFKHMFRVSTSSSVDRRGNLRWDEFSKIRVPLPSLEEQRLIFKTLLDFRHEIELMKELSEKYKTQKRGLMQKLLTGEWRAKEGIHASNL